MRRVSYIDLAEDGKVVVEMQHATIQLFVIDAEELSRTGFCLLFSRDERISIVGSANTIENALLEIEKMDPDVVAIKAEMPGPQFIEAVRRLRMTFPQVRILALLDMMEPGIVASMIENDISGICSVQSNVGDVMTAIRAIAGGCMWFDPKVSQVVKSLVKASSCGRSHDGQPRLLTASLTERENEILQLMTRRLSNQQIAEQLHLSVETVKTYIRRIMDKSAIRNRRELLSSLENPTHRAPIDVRTPDKG